MMVDGPKPNDRSSRGRYESDLSLSQVYNIHSFYAPGTGSGYRIKHGTMLKQSPSIPYWWQERFFVLKSNATICYYLNVQNILSSLLSVTNGTNFIYFQEKACNENKPEKGIIRISDLVVNTKAENGLYDSVKVDGQLLFISVKDKNNRVYRLKCDSEGSALSWRDAIHTHIDLMLNQSVDRSGGNLT